MPVEKSIEVAAFMGCRWRVTGRRDVAPPAWLRRRPRTFGACLEKRQVSGPRALQALNVNALHFIDAAIAVDSSPLLARSPLRRRGIPPVKTTFALLFAMTSVLCAQDLPLKWEQLPPLPQPLGVAAPFAGVTGGSLLVAGGANFPGKMPWEGGKKAWLDTVWLLDRPDGSWREVGKLPRPLAYGLSISAKDGVVCVGGSDAERHYPDSFHLVWSGGKLSLRGLPPLPIPLSGAAGAVAGTSIYVACGAGEPGEKAATNRAFSLDLNDPAPTWKPLPPLPGKGRILAAGTALDGAFYVLGGAALERNAQGAIGREYLRDAWSYRPDVGWKRLADLPKSSVAAPSPAPIVDGRILLIAGDDGSRVGFQPVEKHPGFPKRILAYDPMRDRWSEGGETPAPRATVPTVEWNGAVVIPSGEVRPGVRSPEVWAIKRAR
jgi:N-acetylneuraminate epimerase